MSKKEIEIIQMVVSGLVTVVLMYTWVLKELIKTRSNPYEGSMVADLGVVCIGLFLYVAILIGVKAVWATFEFYDECDDVHTTLEFISLFSNSLDQKITNKLKKLKKALSSLNNEEVAFINNYIMEVYDPKVFTAMAEIAEDDDLLYMFKELRFKDYNDFNLLLNGLISDVKNYRLLNEQCATVLKVKDDMMTLNSILEGKVEPINIDELEWRLKNVKFSNNFYNYLEEKLVEENNALDILEGN